MTADGIDEVARDCESVSFPPGSGWVRADGRPIGVTINKGALFTRSAHVRLTIRAPEPPHTCASPTTVASTPG